MRPPVPTVEYVTAVMTPGVRILVCAWMAVTVSGAAIAQAQLPQGAVVGWGDNFYGQTNVPAPNTGFVAVAAGGWHSLGLKADGSIAAWGRNNYGQTNVPAPNTGFVAVAAGYYHSLGLKADGSIVAWGYNEGGQTNVPAPNTGFVAIAGGLYHSLAIRRAAPPHDDCFNSLSIGEGMQVITNINATTDQSGETCVYRFGSDLWYRFTSPRSGEATISLCGSDYDTAIAVYQGLSCPPTDEPLACNDDSRCGTEHTRQSNVSFPAYRGTEYLIRVGGYNGAQGNGQMNINVEGAGCGDSNAGNCCSAHAGTACSTFDCCQAVCACDPYCCDTEWDDLCALESIGEEGCDAALAPCGPKLVVAPSSRNVPAGAGTTNFAVSNSRCGSMTWTATVVQGSWLTVTSGASGTNGGIVWVSHQANSSPTPRTGTVRVSAPGATPSYVDATLVQAGNVTQPTVDRFRFSAITSPQTTGASFEVTISARRVDESLDTSFNSEVQLSATSSANVTPSRARLSGGTWTGQLSVDRPYAETRLRAYWNGVAGESEDFSVTTDKGSGYGSLAGFVSEIGGDGNGAEVILLPADGENPRSVFTPETCPPGRPANPGQFCFSTVAAGRYYVSARKGELRSTVEEIRVQERFPSSITLQLRDAPPVLFVPGFPASGMKGSPIPMFIGSPGSLPPSELELIDVPLFHSIWGDLRSLLGYYFQVIDAPWDWRDPIDKATIDKYLVPAILKARGCSDVNRSDCRWPKIDVVAHSYGGILSRAYIESEEYGQWNEIDHFAMLGTPNEGAAIIYYLWQGADSRTADQVAYKWSVTMPVNLYIYTNVLNANFFLAKGFPAFVGVTPLPGGILPICTSLGPCVRTAKHEDIFDFIRDFIPGGGDILMVSEFLDRNGARFAPSDATPGLIADLAANPSRNRMTSENGDSSLVRTKLFLSDSADHKAVESIVVGPPNPSGKFYRDGTPIGSPRKAAGDGTVLAYPLERVGLSSISVDRTRAAEHSDLMNEYGDEVCRFLRNGEACVPTVTAEEEAPARILNISLVGRAQPYIVAPDAAGATGTPPGSEDIEVGIIGSIYSVGIDAAGVSLRDPTDGVYQVRMSGLDGEIFTVNMVYATDQSQEQVVFRGVGREAPHSFDLRLAAGESPILQPDYVVEPPTDIRALRIGETTRVTWNPSPNGQFLSYNVYGRPADAARFSQLGNTSAASFDTGHPWKTNEDDVLWTYFVVAVTAEGLESFFTEQVENRTPLVAAFSGAPPVGPRPLTTTFQDESGGEVSAWAWDFDSDGAVDSTDQSPSFTFEQPGLYSVTLTVGGPSGTDTTVEVAYVRVDALGDVDRNDRVDLADYPVFAKAMLGPEVDPDTAPDIDPKARAGWGDFDFEFDRDVDLRDLAVWQNAFTGP